MPGLGRSMANQGLRAGFAGAAAGAGAVPAAPMLAIMGLGVALGGGPRSGLNVGGGAVDMMACVCVRDLCTTQAPYGFRVFFVFPGSRLRFSLPLPCCMCAKARPRLCRCLVSGERACQLSFGPGGGCGEMIVRCDRDLWQNSLSFLGTL